MTSLVMENVRPFPFFDLPSELRNMVYDHLMEFKKHVFEKEDDDLPPYWKVNIAHIRTSNLLQTAAT